MQKFVAFLFLFLLVGSSVPTSLGTEIVDSKDMQASGRATGVDVTLTDVSFSYTTAGDEEQYRMFSSNYPVPGFNRPALLYVVDAVVDVPIQVDVMVENLGTASSGTIDVNIKVLHNEYTLFEMINETVQLGSLSGGNSNSISKCSELLNKLDSSIVYSGIKSFLPLTFVDVFIILKSILNG